MGITSVLILTITAIPLLAAVTAVTVVEKRRYAIRKRFGPEFARLLLERSSRKAAYSEARRRMRARADLQTSPLSPDDLEYYTRSWDVVQDDFAEHPVPALAAADRLVRSVLHDRGYPSDPDTQFALLSVAHGAALARYRDARRALAEAQENPNSASKEDLRPAMSSCGRLLDELLMDADVPRPRGSRVRVP